MPTRRTNPEQSIQPIISADLSLSYNIQPPPNRSRWTDILATMKVGASVLLKSDVDCRSFTNAARLANYVTRSQKRPEEGGWRVWLTDRT